MPLFKLFFIILFIFSSKAQAKDSLLDRVKMISDEYLIISNLTQKECEKLIAGECFRRDHMRDKPYYHESRVVIFYNKIFATQFFENKEKSKNMLFLKVKDGAYQLRTDRENLISFAVKNGEISELKLIQGDLEKEKKLQSKCDLSEAIYGFYQAYDKSQILEKSALFSDEKNFSGLKEFIIFKEKSRLQQPLVLLKNSARDFEAIEDIKLCKMPNRENFLLKQLSQKECVENFDKNAVECSEFSGCEDYLIIEDCKITLLAEELK